MARPLSRPCVQMAVSQGWIVVSDRKHLKLRCACGKHQVTCSVSPSDFRAEQKAMSVFRRASCWDRAKETGMS